MVDPLDQFLAGLILRMRLAAVDDLQRPYLARKQAEALGVAEKQVGALVGGGAPGETDSHHRFFELDSGALLDLLEEGTLGLCVCLLDLSQWNPHGIAQVEIVTPPSRNIVVIKLAEGRRRPRNRVHPIRDGVDGETGKKPLGDESVLHGHTVGITRKPKRQVSHVQGVVGTAFGGFQDGGSLLTQNLGSQFPGKLIVAGGYRRVSGEDAMALDLVYVLFRNTMKIRLAKPAFEQGEDHKRRVALVHVVLFNIRMPHRTQDVHAAHAEDDFLTQAVTLVAAVQAVREGLVPGTVFGQSGVQQINGYHVP